MGEENAVQLSAEETRRLYGLLALRGKPPDAVVGRILEKLERYLYRTLTVEEMEELRRSRAPDAGRAR